MVSKNSTCKRLFDPLFQGQWIKNSQVTQQAGSTVIINSFLKVQHQKIQIQHKQQLHFNLKQRIYKTSISSQEFQNCLFGGYFEVRGSVVICRNC
ncbi:unnamed protein product [Paramecium octaurelia]|nr:unnamed protein product [Paramecium octaurelia]